MNSIESGQSMAGPIRLSPEELARLETSVTNFLNNYTVPSIHFDTSPPGRPTMSMAGAKQSVSGLDEIGGRFSAGRLVNSMAPTMHALEMNEGNGARMGMNSGRHNVGLNMVNGTIGRATSPTDDLSTKAMPPTPPVTSSPFAEPIKPSNAFLHTATTTGSADQLRRLYEERLEATRRNEEERRRLLEDDCKDRLQRLEADLRQQLDVLSRSKAESERSLMAEIGRLKDEVARLTVAANKAEQYRSDLLRLKGHKGDDEDMRRGEGEEEHERRIAELIEQFDKERKAAARIMATRVRSHLALLMPRLRQQAREAAEAEHVRHIEKLRKEHAAELERLRREHAEERKWIVKQAKEEAEAELREWQAKVRERVRVKMAQMRNEAERAALKRYNRVLL